MRERVRYLYDSLQTEKAYVYWAKAFVLWMARSHDGSRHPREMGQTEREDPLTMLATLKQVTPATHRHALNALLFLYRQVLARHGVALDATDGPTADAQALFGGTASPLDAMAFEN